MIKECVFAVILAVCYGYVEIYKRSLKKEENHKNIYPFLSASLGALLGGGSHLAIPSVAMSNSVFGSVGLGVICGLAATGVHEFWHRIRRKKSSATEDPIPPRYYITGDKHRNFEALIAFCKLHRLRKNDVIVILGDSGFNYYGDERDRALKARLSKLNVTLFCIHGNKENRPQNLPTYGIRTFCGGTVYYEPRYPTLLFAKDGEVYRFHDKEFMVIGGAHSVDKLRCLEEQRPFWEDEMPDSATKQLVEERLHERGNKIFGFLTHTCPISCLPTEMFISTERIAEKTSTGAKNKKRKRHHKKQEEKSYPLDIDRSTESWLETLKDKVSFSEWYCGHYHVDKELGQLRMLYREILPFCPIDDA